VCVVERKDCYYDAHVERYDKVVSSKMSAHLMRKQHFTDSACVVTLVIVEMK